MIGSTFFGFIRCGVKIQFNLLFHFEDLPDYPECSSYAWFKEANRNEKYTSGGSLWDSGLSGWYRFGGQAGTKIATSCVPYGHCGSTSTGWMIGSHPAVSDGKVNRTVCYRNYHDNCCWQRNTIEVLNCGNYLVHKFGKTPGCNYRYCGSFN